MFGCIVIVVWMSNYGTRLFEGTRMNNVIRVVYAALFTVAMEYVARYSHLYLWHSKYLWWIHGSHHHQYPAIGSVPTYDHRNNYVSPVIERNDAFPVAFGVLAVALMDAGSNYPSTVAKDCWTGIALGATIFGLSYFTGHDIVAHERLGKRIARWLRSCSSYVDECATVHFKYHHKLTKRDDGNDPYGPPYGFWLGPQEVESLKRGEEYAPMPRPYKAVLAVAVGVCMCATMHDVFAF